MFICTKCGNYERFIKMFSKHIYPIYEFDEDCDDYNEDTSQDWDSDHDWRDVKDFLQCEECESEAIITADVKEGYSYIAKHTDKKNKWHMEELPENEQNKELLNQWVLKQI